MEDRVNNALEVNNLCIDFGKFRIGDLSLAVKKGAITGLIGANGAGKSTLINAVMRAVKAESGSILYDGKRFAGNEKQILSSIACVFDEPKFGLTQKPKSIAKLYKGLYPTFDEKKFYELCAKFDLPQDRKIIKYSFGMKKKILISLELSRNPDLLILDEPTSGVDPYDRNEIITLIQEYMTDENHAVLFSTHITEDLDKIADYIVMLDNGNKILDEDKESLKERYRLVRAKEMTDELRGCAIGITSDMFGYTFLTANTGLKEDENLQIRPASVQEIFVHLVGNKKQYGTDFVPQDIFDI